MLVINYHNYEMCCYKKEMSAPKRVIDSKAWCPLGFLKKLTLIDWYVVIYSIALLFAQVVYF